MNCKVTNENIEKFPHCFEDQLLRIVQKSYLCGQI